jgi:predicted PurR-regulated permease PerM
MQESIDATPATGQQAEESAGETQLPLRRPAQAMRLMLTVLTALALLYTLAVCDSLVVPLVLAIFLGLGLNPLVAAAVRMHVSRALAALVVMLAVVGGSVGAVTLLAPPAAAWLQQAPHAIRSLAPKLKPITRKLNEANKATQSLVGTPTASSTPAPARATFDVWDVLALTPRVLAFSLTVALLVFFFLIYGDRLLLKLVEVSPSFATKRHAVGIVRSIQSEISRYIFTAACINLALGAVTAVMLWLLGMPDPLLWGGVAAMANFVPYVGAITTTLVLAVAGSMHFPQLSQAFLPALGFAALTAVEGNFITPLIMGRRLRLSPVAILLWLMIWAWLWGIAGALLAVPMLTSAKLIAERVRGWEWFAILVSR